MAPPKAIWVEVRTRVPSAALLALFNNDSSINCTTTTENGETTIKAQWVPPEATTLELPVGPFTISLRHTGDAVEVSAPAFLASFITGLPDATLSQGAAKWRLVEGHYGPVGVRGLASFTLVI